MREILAVYRKELRQIARDRRTLMILAFIPAFFLLLYGYALNFDIRNVNLAVEDRDGTAESRALVSAFVNSGYFDLAGGGLFAGRGRTPARSERRPGRPGHSRGIQPGRHGRVRQPSRCSSAATTPTPRRP